MQHTCPDCQGSGEVEWPKPVHRPGESSTVTIKCPRCNGTGYIDN